LPGWYALDERWESLHHAVLCLCGVAAQLP